MIRVFALAGVFALLGLAILSRPSIVHRYALRAGRLDPDEYPFTGRRVVWYRRSSVVPFAVGAMFLGVAISRL